jgi:hypothetical protein
VPGLEEGELQMRQGTLETKGIILTEDDGCRGTPADRKTRVHKCLQKAAPAANGNRFDPLA